jgi:5-methylcytosine-specific restriction endonuclease McrA
MNFLGIDYIISSLLWLLVMGAFVFTFRKPIMKLLYKKTSVNLFTSKLKNYLEKTYPDIKFDYTIIDESESESNPDVRKYSIADEMIEQFKRVTIDETQYPKNTPKELQWSSYLFNCEPNKDKLPPDWVQRKNALCLRDNRKCFRCSKHIDINSSYPKMIRSLEDGGKYYLENLIPLCSDCDKLLSNNPKKSTFLNIKDSLYEIAENS